MAVVIDASIALAWCFPEEEGSSAADAVAMQIIREPGMVPALFWSEIRDVLIRSERDERIDRAGTEHFLGLLDQFQFEVDQGHSEAATLALARHYSLTVYDAAYLETALRRRASLATLDTELAEAAAREGVLNSPNQ